MNASLCLRLVVAACVGCAAPAAPSAPQPPHAPHEAPLPGAVWPPPGYVPPACELEVSTRAAQRGGVYEVTAVARNKSAHPIELELPSRCPQGPIVFGGQMNG